MNLLKKLLNEKTNRLCSVFFSAGFPQLNDTKKIIQDLDANGVDFIEVGLPYSDPMADGETIQYSSAVALENGINLDVRAGEVHAIMGPNGSGKSTLSSVIAGDETYEVSSGSILFDDDDLLDLDPDQRAHKGVFLSFQYPVEIPGISVSNFLNQTSLKSAYVSFIFVLFFLRL